MIQAPRAQVLGQEQQASGITLEEIIGMLMNGISPEELVRQGVPVEMIKQAITYIMQQEEVTKQQSQPIDQSSQARLANPLV